MSLRSLAADLLPSALRRRARPRPNAAGPDAPVRPDASTYAELAERIGYLSKAEQAQVREAWRFADEAHLGQKRASGEPYITHPLAVAGICADWRMDVQALMAALTHDAMEDCGITKSDILERFGSVTADLVDGLTKLDKLQFATREETQAESFRKMLLAMARDVRVILIKLADRLHNMRTMGAMAQHKRARIARETLDIYAPIAHRLGLNEVYRELQDISFACVYPWRSRIITEAMRRSVQHPREIVERVRQDVERAFAAARLRVTLEGRTKESFSIYNKMKDKHASFADINDLFGFRVVVGTMPQCYTALGVLHHLYKPMPGRFKDYVALPKANGYQSLHTTLVSPLGTPIEFQIRTEEMHLVAEKGVAAHWAYKDRKPARGRTGASGGSGQPGAEDDPQGMGWLQSLLDIQNTTRDSLEFFEHVKVDLYPESVYVFTPKNRILTLPKGSTPVDFAYAVHSDVGHRCVAARINDEAVPLRTRLVNGDRVEIIQGAQTRPNPAWLDFVRTGKARAKIRNYLKTAQTQDALGLGERMLGQALRALGYALPAVRHGDAPADQAHNQQVQQLWQQVTRWAESKGRDELLIDLALGRKVAALVAQRMATLLTEQGHKPDPVQLSLSRYAPDEAVASHGLLVIDGSEGASIQISPCCRPIPGDPIRGYLGRGEALQVHHAECRQVKRSMAREGDRWMPLEWAESPVRAFETALSIWVQNGQGRLAAVIAAIKGDITHVDLARDAQADGVEEINIRFLVQDRLHLADILRRVRQLAFVHKVTRLRGQADPAQRPGSGAG
ncbi:RelA/SpoT family protein [Amphibiibacter pelophylacis]|uniref:Bifunctional (P)ppGpp synthetase/guanosine-3',5'-bis(Diphosphate) 3'-pyrophosphohydrolase n=1 Tax=Amphibiibacter pelophylacis TaxID=1799477 RepID=A0ACC6P1P1_9BURK